MLLDRRHEHVVRKQAPQQAVRTRYSDRPGHVRQPMPRMAQNVEPAFGVQMPCCRLKRPGRPQLRHVTHHVNGRDRVIALFHLKRGAIRVDEGSARRPAGGRIKHEWGKVDPGEFDIRPAFLKRLQQEPGANTQLQYRAGLERGDCIRRKLRYIRWNAGLIQPCDCRFV